MAGDSRQSDPTPPDPRAKCLGERGIRTRCSALLFVVGVAACANAVAGEAPDGAAAGSAPDRDVDVTVRYEVETVGPSGIHRIDRWQERLIRQGSTLWIERILPGDLAGAEALERPSDRPSRKARPAASIDGGDPHADHRHEGGPGSVRGLSAPLAPAPTGRQATAAGPHLGHKHFDYDRSARLVERQADGSLRLRYVDREHRVIVEVPPAEYVSVGFRPDWVVQSRFMSRRAFDTMGVPEAGAGPSQGATGWRTEFTPGWRHRVRWSPELDMPARIESRSEDGRTRRVVTVEAKGRRGPVNFPWQELEGYAARQYDDFTD